MKLQLIRNATMKITYAGRCFLTDPMLSAKHAIESFAGLSANPTVDLPLDVRELLKGVEAVIVSHIHKDHFDGAARVCLAKDMMILCQAGDEARLEANGFKHIVPISKKVDQSGMSIYRVDGRHGSDHWEEKLGPVSGFVFQAKGEPVVYWAGDTVLCEAVEQAILAFEPDVIILHSGGAKLPGSDLIIMDAKQTLAICDLAPKAKVVAVHLEALDHLTITRADLKQAAEKAGIGPDRLLIPRDGEAIQLNLTS